VSHGSGDQTRHDCLRLPAEGDSAAVFRQYVRLACHQCHRDGLLERVLLVTDALVANSIRHSTPAGERFVELSLVPTQRGVQVRVKDGDPSPPVPRQAGADEIAGRGLQVVEAVASAWGYEQEADGKTTWADIEPD
jgi:anti-sigma regulatory factor (Ser/Thr protein kinase)